MFGRNKAGLEALQQTQGELAQTSEIVLQFADKKEFLEGNISDIADNRKRMAADLEQVKENTRTASELAQQNIDDMAAMSRAITGYQGQMKQAEAEYTGICSQIETHLEHSMALVEGNKHFTTPAKHISETAGCLMEHNRSCMSELLTMGEYGKEMGVLALNAAIEAGRMGDTGKEFVLAAEQVRTCAGKYEASVQKLQEQVKASDEKVQELENQVHHMVALLKENNVDTTKLMKLCDHTMQTIKKSTMHASSADMITLKDQITGIRNAEEEILKVEERNMLQLSDITEEYQIQEADSREISDALQTLLVDAVTYKNERGGNKV